MPMLDELAARLASAGVAGNSTSDAYFLAKGTLPDSTLLNRPVVALLETQGLAPEQRAALLKPGLQVLIRGLSMEQHSSAYPDARAKAEAVDIVLRSIGNETLSGVHYTGVWAEQTPFHVGWDSEQRPLFSCNYVVYRASSS